MLLVNLCLQGIKLWSLVGFIKLMRDVQEHTHGQTRSM